MFYQTFNLTDYDGNEVQLDTNLIHDNQHLAVQSGIIWSVQLGLSIAVLALLFMTATPAKYALVVFRINVLALSFNIVRCILQCIAIDGPLTAFTTVMLRAYNEPEIPRGIVISATCSVISFFVFVLIEISLLIQVAVIFKSEPRRVRRPAVALVLLIALVAVGWRLALAIVNIQATVHVASGDFVSQSWVQLAANVTTIISIGANSLIFTGKVGYMIHKRRKMNLKPLDKFQVLFIIGCQTLILPVVFAAIAFFALKGVQLQSFVDTFVAISLPLSGIWSSANVETKKLARHPAAVLHLTSEPSDNDQPTAPTTVDEALLAAEQNDGVEPRERSFWEMIGSSRDQVMLNDLDNSTTAVSATTGTTAAATPSTTTTKSSPTITIDQREVAQSPASKATRAESTHPFRKFARYEHGKR